MLRYSNSAFLVGSGALNEVRRVRSFSVACLLVELLFGSESPTSAVAATSRPGLSVTPCFREPQHNESLRVVSVVVSGQETDRRTDRQTTWIEKQRGKRKL